MNNQRNKEQTRSNKQRQQQQQILYQQQHQQENLAQNGLLHNQFVADATNLQRVPGRQSRPSSRFGATGAQGSEGKDLIIRMLAEVFQVVEPQLDGQQAKWQQVSSSLVPISLYSRTTSKWLNYLLFASSQPQPQHQQQHQYSQQNATNAMSPDSRDFLLLLQRLHQDARYQQSVKKFTAQQSAELDQKQQQPGTVLFQVVAHDYFDGQCKKILNVKIAQPGTRLGQASDYFVYWKEPTAIAPSTGKMMAQHQQQMQRQVPFIHNSYRQSSQMMHRLNTSIAQQQQQLYSQSGFNNDQDTCCYTGAQQPWQQQQQTWGLNFASVNDAKLFYAICSLNQVDLNFNSDYLKQLAIKAPNQTSGDRQEQKLIRDFLNYKQQQQQQRGNNYHVDANSAEFNQKAKCQSCKQIPRYLQQECLLHHSHTVEPLAGDAISGRQSGTGLRTRSRSAASRRGVQCSGETNTMHQTTTQQLADCSGKPEQQQQQQQRRIRSYSTPASPERDPNCPVHQQQQQQHLEFEREQEETLLQHHPRCLSSYYLQQEREREREYAPTGKPRKPARGLLRDSSSSQQVANSAEDDDGIVVVKRATTSVFKGMEHKKKQHQQQQRQQILTGDHTVSGEDETMGAHQRDATLARAQYANSKNLKEFLSLDAGGQPTTPTQLAALNQRFQQQLRASVSGQQPRDRAAAAVTTAASKKIGRVPPDAMFQDQEEQPEAKDASDKLSADEQQRRVKSNASTTTDDLPPLVDVQRQAAANRMFKLTSPADEVISERTEPASFASGGGGGGRDRAQADSSWNRRQTRAVSLGPELEAAPAADGCEQVQQTREDGLNKEQGKSLSVRSDSGAGGSRGRRRSLERSMCVDLSNQQLESNHCPPQVCDNNHNRAQQPLPAAAASHRMGGPRQEPSVMVQVDELRPETWHLHRQQLEPASFTTDTASNQLSTRRTRTRSSNAATDATATPTTQQQCSCKQLWQVANNHHFARPTSMGLFKSVPDMSRVETMPPQNVCYGQQQHHWRVDHSAIRGQLHQVHLGGSHAAAYAAPLCGEPSGLISSMSYSCPNSLRRKRRPICQRAVPAPVSAGCGSGQCHCQMCQVAFAAEATECGIPSASQGADLMQGSCSNCAPNTAALLNRQLKAQMMDNVSPDFGHQSLRFARSTTARSKQTYYSSQRPCSSLSSKSPLHYGLYESDDEDLEANTCKRGLCDCQQVYSRPSAQNFKPVQGYDQTMARTSLKWRQRARSQPPGKKLNLNSNSADGESSSQETAEQVSHLTKSMENVQKLIKEVQSELRALSNREPLAAMAPAHCLQRQAPATLAQQQVPQAPIVDTKMHQEEQQSQRWIQQQQQQKLAGSSSTRSAGQFKCVGAIRKAGFLSVKKWIIKRHQSIELARKQGWKRYWVCLRGTALLFHTVIDKKEPIEVTQQSANTIDLASWIQENCCADSQLQLTKAALSKATGNELTSSTMDGQQFAQMSQCFIEREPRHLIIVDGAIGQPIPEHPKRDFVFCLSTTFGDAYLFQASCQLESDNWISALHNACAASIARDLTRDEATKFFEAKIRHLEMEAEKKLFLRVRLESRLNSMSSMSHISALVVDHKSNKSLSKSANELEDKRATMRSLLFKLQQQLLALDNYLEQVHCEIYQLRCYLTSCLAQHIFYQPPANHTGLISASAIDLPHPRALLMHVSKPTKLLLIKLGVFTVSSLHAFIHARQGSADSILLKIQEHAEKIIGNFQEVQSEPKSTRQRAQSISERLLGSKKLAIELETDTEQLIQLSDLKTVSIRLARSLFEKIRVNSSPISQSDDRYSIHDDGKLDSQPSVNLKLNPNSSAIDIVKLLLSVLQSADAQDSALNYYLRLQPWSSNQRQESSCERKTSYVPKRCETLTDWTSFEYLELAEKIVFKVQLTRGRPDDEAAPFGFSVGAQLIEVGNKGQQLDVYCSYIEWGSVADKAGLMDEDELLMINGIPVMDLDMMFIECIIQEETNLHLVVRSSRSEAPAGAILLDRHSWSPANGGGDSGGSQERPPGGEMDLERFQTSDSNLGSKLITDEYISSLVCPPPPSRSKAFLRTDTSLLRQKSDLHARDTQTAGEAGEIVAENNLSRLVASATIPSLTGEANLQFKAKSQVELRTDDEETREISESQIDKKSEKEEEATTSWDTDSARLHSQVNKVQDPNRVERMRKSILELLETEYAFIRHLDTINEHYMRPISESNYLNIKNLERLHQEARKLFAFQKGFFVKILQSLSSTYLVSSDSECNPTTNHPELTDLLNESEQLNKIFAHLDSMVEMSQFKPMLKAIARLFTLESDNFRTFSSYTVAYSRLQKCLHPNTSETQSTILPAQRPVPLDTFVPSTQANNSQAPATSMSQRDLFKPFGSFMPYGSNNGGNSKNAVSNTSSNSSNSSSISEQQLQQLETQLKQLSEILANLDSSSSSISHSLPSKSSNCSSIDNSQSDSQKRAKISSRHFKKSLHQQSFESYLIKPIQRVTKYPLLLQSMAQVYSQGSETDNDPTTGELQYAHEIMSAIASHVNDSQRIQDEFGPTFGNIERLFHSTSQESKLSNNSLMSQPPINLGIEHLLHYGPVEWLNLHEFAAARSGSKRISIPTNANLNQMLFVFKSCVVFICKERVETVKDTATCNGSSKQNILKQRKLISSMNGSSFHANGHEKQKNLSEESHKEVIRYQSIIPVCEVQVRSVTHPATNGRQDACYQWELFRCSSVNSNSNLLTKTSKQRQSTNGKVYLLASESNEVRNAFLRKIRMIIRDSVRNMSLPIARSPSSKSLTPKKLSSPTTSSASTSSKTQTTDSCSHCEKETC